MEFKIFRFGVAVILAISTTLYLLILRKTQDQAKKAKAVK